MISKELLSEVLKKQVNKIITDPNEDCTIGLNEIIICFDGYMQKWNIFELADKIENWIESKDINVIRIKENNFYEFYINAYIDENYKVLVFEDSITSNIKINGIVAVAEFILNKVSK